MKDKKTLAEIAREIEMPEPTARRYATRHKAFFPTRTLGRRKLYEDDAGQILCQIQRLYGEGMEAPHVQEVLSESMPERVTYEHMPVVDQHNPPMPQVADAAGLAILAPILERYAAAIETQAAAQVRLAEAIERRNEIMESRLIVLEKAARATQTARMTQGPAKVQDAPQAGGERRPATRQEIVARVLELRREGHGKRTIAGRMEREGWPTVSGRGAWGVGTVGRILKGEIKA